MAKPFHFYYITDRTAFPGDEVARRECLLEKIGEAACAGVDWIQLREKDLSARDLEELAGDAVRAVQEARSATKLLINSRTDVALAVGAGGVHLRGDDVSSKNVRTVLSAAGEARSGGFVIGVSCHSVEEVRRAGTEGADFAVLAPIFGKTATNTPAVGVEALRIACGGMLPVLALGGVTVENAGACLAAGAAGIAGVRLFQENNADEIVRQLQY